MASNLLVRPANLTQIGKNNDGMFPFWSIYKLVDGQREVQGHGRGAMPIWGQVFERQEKTGNPELQEEVILGRLLSLVYYLESIQEP